MINQIILVGRLASEPMFSKNGDSNYLEFLLECQRPFKDSNGNFKNDIFNVRVWRGASNQIKEQATIGSLICVKGSMFLENEPYVNSEIVHIIRL